MCPTAEAGLGPTGVAHVADALAINTSLTRLNLSGVPPLPAGCFCRRRPRTLFGRTSAGSARRFGAVPPAGNAVAVCGATALAASLLLNDTLEELLLEGVPLRGGFRGRGAGGCPRTLGFTPLIKKCIRLHFLDVSKE